MALRSLHSSRNIDKYTSVPANAGRRYFMCLDIPVKQAKIPAFVELTFDQRETDNKIVSE